MFRGGGGTQACGEDRDLYAVVAYRSKSERQKRAAHAKLALHVVRDLDDLAGSVRFGP